MTEDILKSGLLHETSVTITIRGRQQKLGFPHKLFQDYLSAFYIISSENDIKEHLKEYFPTWDAIVEHEEIVRFCCGLSRENDDIMCPIINSCKQRMTDHLSFSFFNYDSDRLLSFQKELGTQVPKYVVCSSGGPSLSEVIHSAQLVYVEDLKDQQGIDGQSCDATLHADIVLDLSSRSRNPVKIDGSLTTLLKCKPQILGIRLHGFDPVTVNQVCSLLPSSSLSAFNIENMIGVSTKVVEVLSEMPQLTDLAFKIISLRHEGLFGLMDGVRSWRGQSRLRVLDLSINNLPSRICKPLLQAVAANCRDLLEVQLDYNDLAGCLVGFLQDPPPQLCRLIVNRTGLTRNDVKSLTAAFREGKLEKLSWLDIRDNFIDEKVLSELLHALLEAWSDKIICTLFWSTVSETYRADWERRLSGCCISSLCNIDPHLESIARDDQKSREVLLGYYLSRKPEMLVDPETGL